MTVDQLIELKKVTADYLREVVNSFAKQLNEFGFLRPERRPA